MERVVAAGSPADGASVRALRLPQHVIILTVLHGDELTFVDADTPLQAGDRLAIVAGRDRELLLDNVFGTQPEDQAAS